MVQIRGGCIIHARKCPTYTGPLFLFICSAFLSAANPFTMVQVTSITLTLSAVSSSVYSASESMDCESATDFKQLTFWMYLPSVVMLVVVGFALFAGRLDNISLLLLGQGHHNIVVRVL